MDVSDTIDLQNTDSPSAKDHSRQPTRPAPLGTGPPAPHQSLEIRKVEEGADDVPPSPRHPERLHDPYHSDFYGDSDDDDLGGQLQHDHSAGQLNGGMVHEDDMDDDDDLDDDMMDKISSSPSIDDGRYITPPALWPERTVSLEFQNLHTSVQLPLATVIPLPDLSGPAVSLFSVNFSRPLQNIFSLDDHHHTSHHQEVQYDSEIRTRPSQDTTTSYPDISTDLTSSVDDLTILRRSYSDLGEESHWSEDCDSDLNVGQIFTTAHTSLLSSIETVSQRFAEVRSSIESAFGPIEPEIDWVEFESSSNSDEETEVTLGIHDNFRLFLLPEDDTFLHTSVSLGDSLQLRKELLSARDLMMASKKSTDLEDEGYDDNDSDPGSSDSWSTVYSESDFQDKNPYPNGIKGDHYDDYFDDELDTSSLSSNGYFPEPRFIDSGWGGECLQATEDIDFEFVYALHTFVATVEGQANATKGDTMVLLDDSNSYWWLVRVVKDGSIGTCFKRSNNGMGWC